jgi:hypothetical protein
MSSYGDDLFAKEIVASGEVKAPTVTASSHLITGGISLGAGATPPASGTAVGELWFVYTTTDTDENNGVYVWSGSEWKHVAQTRAGA